VQQGKKLNLIIQIKFKLGLSSSSNKTFFLIASKALTKLSQQKDYQHLKRLIIYSCQFHNESDFKFS